MLTVAERQARGKAARNEAPRSCHGDWAPARDRPDPIALLEEQDRTRVPDLVPIRYGRMAASPFAFFRGAAAVMASDLAPTPRTGLTVQACGDAHLMNFGGFAAPDRHAVFDLNDFDETLSGPWEWDVKRLAASLVLAGRDRGLDGPECGRVVRATSDEYRTIMAELAQLGRLDVWYVRVDIDTLIDNLPKVAGQADVERARRNMAKARHKDRLRALRKLTVVEDGALCFASQPPLLVPVREMLPSGEAEKVHTAVGELLEQYRATLRPEVRHLLEGYRYVDLAHKVVGVGSVGTRAWVVLLIGRDSGDPLFLQVKEAQASVLERYLGSSGYDNHGRRVVEGQRLTQAASDILLGWLRSDEAIGGVSRDFYVRQLWDWKQSAGVETMDAHALELYGRLCGGTLARAHARSGDPIAISGYLGRTDRFDQALAAFAEAYADQSERDHRALLDAIENGRVEAQRGV